MKNRFDFIDAIAGATIASALQFLLTYLQANWWAVLGSILLGIALVGLAKSPNGHSSLSPELEKARLEYKLARLKLITNFLTKARDPVLTAIVILTLGILVVQCMSISVRNERSNQPSLTPQHGSSEPSTGYIYGSFRHRPVMHANS